MPSTEIKLGGMYPIGDAAKMPQGKSRLARNVFVRPGGEIVGRDALVEDIPSGRSLVDGAGRLGIFFDEQASDSKLVFVDSGGKFFVRNTAGTWTQKGTGDELVDWTNLLGHFVYVGEDGIVRRYDGDNDTTYYFDYPYTYVKAGVCESFINRLFLGDITVSVKNELVDVASPYPHYSYFETTAPGSFGWNFQNVSKATTTVGSTVLVKLTPTVSSGAAFAYLVGGNYSGAGVVSRTNWPVTTTPKATWRIDIRNRSEEYIPLKFEVIHGWVRVSGDSHVVGDIVIPFPAECKATADYTDVYTGVVTVDSTTSMPSQGTLLVVETGEILQYTAKAAGQITVSARGVGGTEAAALLSTYNLTTQHGRAYICTTAGANDAGGPPIWDPTPDSSTTDNACVWKCISTDVVGSFETDLLKRSEVPEDDGWVSYAVKGVMSELGPATARAAFGIRINWGNSGATEWPLQAIDVAWKDGLLDADAEKRNYGQQLTFSDLDMPFYNNQTTTTRDVKFPRRIMWTETDFNTIRAENYWDMDGVDTPVSAIKAVENRLHVFTQDSLTVFQGTADPNFPLQRASSYKGIGCTAPKNLIQVDGTLMFLDDSNLYATQGGRPEEIVEDGMRRHLFPLGSNSALGIDRLNNELYIADENKRAYVLNLDTREWSYVDVKNSADTAMEQFRDFAYWDDKFWCVTETDIVRRARSDVFRDNSNSTDRTVLKMYALPTIDAAAPKMEFLLREVELRHRITKAGQSISVYLSKDRWKQSKTGEKYVTLTIDELAELESYGDGTYAAVNEPTTESAKLPFWQGRIEDLPILLIHDGDSGETAFRLSGVIYHLDTQGEHIQNPVPTISGSSL